MTFYFHVILLCRHWASPALMCNLVRCKYSLTKLLENKTMWWKMLQFNWKWFPPDGLVLPDVFSPLMYSSLCSLVLLIWISPQFLSACQGLYTLVSAVFTSCFPHLLPSVSCSSIFNLCFLLFILWMSKCFKINHQTGLCCIILWYACALQYAPPEFEHLITQIERMIILVSHLSLQVLSLHWCWNVHRQRGKG